MMSKSLSTALVLLAAAASGALLVRAALLPVTVHAQDNSALPWTGAPWPAAAQPAISTVPSPF